MAHIFEKKWRSQDVRLRENVDFTALLLSKRVLEGLRKAGFKKPSPIQLEAIPMGKFGRDLLVQAKSGTGKTLVFVIVALEMLNRKLFRPQVLIVVPTREIASQVSSVVKSVADSHRLTCSCFIGGLPLFEDKEKAVLTQIAVGTPGRLRQLIDLGCLPTQSIRLLVFDEADQLLHCNTFKEDIEAIFKSLPDDKQVIATSATFRMRKGLHQYLSNPYMVRLNAKELALLAMAHYATIVDYCPMPIILYKRKFTVLEKILKTVTFAQCLVFCNGIQQVEVVYKNIKQFGFSVAYMSSAKDQCDRLKAIERLKRFRCKVLVSSDLTSRGIDAENVDLVINFDLNHISEVYMHRVGRAGRFGSIGAAISIISDKDLTNLKQIEKDGSFKTFILPDPIPENLILYPCESIFVIHDAEHAESLEPNVQCGEINNSEFKERANRKNNQMNGASESIGEKACGDVTSETVVLSAIAAGNDEISQDYSTDPSEGKINDEKVDEDTELSQIQTTGQNMQNGNESTQLTNNEDADFPNEDYNAPEPSESKNNAESTEDDSKNCEQKSIPVSNSEQSSDRKIITVDMINNLNLQKREFFYKICKKFEESVCSVVSQKETKEEEKISGEDHQNTDLVSDEMSTMQLTENSESESREDFLEKPNFESTPQHSDKITQETVKMVTDKPSRLLFRNTPDEVCERLSEDSDSSEDVSDSSRQKSTVHSASDSLSSSSQSSSSSTDSESDSDQSSSDSESDSDQSSSDSESDSDQSSSTTSESGDERGEHIYHHNYSRRGRQNPSLISQSVSDYYNDRMHLRRGSQKCKCISCNNAMPQQCRIGSRESHRRHDCHRESHRRHDCHRESHRRNDCHREHSAYFQRHSCFPGRKFHAANGERGNVPQSHFPQRHSDCHRARKSTRNEISENNQNRSDHPSDRRSSRHVHTLGCYLPTEHRCHPNTPDYPCAQGHLCEMWYNTWYNQWLHIQNVIH